MKALIREFKEFISKGNVMSMAVGLIVGSAFTAIVTSLNQDIITPLLGLILGQIDFTSLSLTVGGASVMYGNFIQARNQLDDLMITNGLSGQDIIKQIHSSIFDLGVSDYDKVKMIDKCGEVEFRIVEGSNDRIQLEVFLAYLVMVGGKAR